MNLQIIDKREILDKEVITYGDFENPLFLAKDVANWIGHTHTTRMLESIEEEEKLNGVIFHAGQNREMTFLTEDGLYEVLMQSRKPIARDFKKKVKTLLKDLRLNKNQFTGLSKELQAIFTLDKKQQETEARVNKLYNIMTIDYSQQEDLRMTANIRVVEILGGKGTEAYKKLKNRVFQDLWRSYKKYFRVNSYRNTAVKDYEEAVNFIENFYVEEVIQYAIEGLNKQMSFA